MRHGLRAMKSFFGARKRWLVAYRAGSDVTAKAAFLVITVAAARRLSPGDSGVFAPGTTTGWVASVAADFGIQLHLARRVALRPAAAASILRAWTDARLATSAVALTVLAASVLVGIEQT